MRSVILLVLATLPACAMFDLSSPPVADDDDDGPRPPEPPRPPDVELGSTRKVAAGTREHFTRPFSAHNYRGVRLVSSDPKLEAYVIDPDHIGFVTHGPGTFQLTAFRDGYSQPAGALTIQALPVEGIYLESLAIPDHQPDLDAFAVARGGLTTMCATYYGPGHDRIPGHGAFATTGGLAVVAQDVPGQDDIRSTCFELEARTTGPATLIASVEGGLSRELSVEIVDQPSSGELTVASITNNSPPKAGELTIARLDPRTANGVYIAEVTATWTSVPDVNGTPYEALLIFTAGPAGTTTTLTATVGTFVATTTFTVQ